MLPLTIVLKNLFCFTDVDFSLTRYCATIQDQSEADSSITDNESDTPMLQPLEDMMSMDNDFMPVVFVKGNQTQPHILSRWYGLRDFIVITPCHGCDITSESKMKILLSSACIAINNSNWYVYMVLFH